MKIIFDKNVSPNQIKSIKKECRQLGIKIEKSGDKFLCIEPLGHELVDFIKHLKGVKGVAKGKDESYSQCWGKD